MQQTNVRLDFHLVPFEIEIHTGYKYSTKCFDMNYIGTVVLLAKTNRTPNSVLNLSVLYIFYILNFVRFFFFVILSFFRSGFQEVPD